MVHCKMDASRLASNRHRAGARRPLPRGLGALVRGSCARHGLRWCMRPDAVPGRKKARRRRAWVSCL